MAAGAERLGQPDLAVRRAPVRTEARCRSSRSSPVRRASALATPSAKPRSQSGAAPLADGPPRLQMGAIEQLMQVPAYRVGRPRACPLSMSTPASRPLPVGQGTSLRHGHDAIPGLSRRP